MMVVDDVQHLLWLAVLAMATAVLTTAYLQRSDGTRAGGDSEAEQTLDTRAKQLEAAGNFDGLAALLLTEWTTKGSSRAVTLAHELSRRYPAEAFQIGCPLQQGKQLPAAAAAADDAGGPAEPTSAAGDAGGVPEEVSGESGGRGLSVAAHCSPPGSGSETAGELAAAGASPSSLDGERDQGDCCGDGGETPRATAPTGEATSPTPPPTPPSPSTTTTTITTTSTTTTTPPLATTAKSGTTTTSKATAGTLPWERGWQGPRDFKPPPSSSASATISDPATATASEPRTLSSRRKREPKGGDPAAGGAAARRRNFTVSQLNLFDGSVPAPISRGGEAKARKARPIYIALRGEVYDASAGRNLYGPVSLGWAEREREGEEGWGGVEHAGKALPHRKIRAAGTRRARELPAARKRSSFLFFVCSSFFR